MIQFSKSRLTGIEILRAVNFNPGIWQRVNNLINIYFCGMLRLTLTAAATCILSFGDFVDEARILSQDPNALFELYSEHVKAVQNGDETSELKLLLEELHTYGEEMRESHSKSPKHVLTILTDDQGWSDVGYHDNTFVTPAIDFLANHGIQLNNFYVQVCKTILSPPSSRMSEHVQSNPSIIAHRSYGNPNWPSGNFIQPHRSP